MTYGETFREVFPYYLSLGMTEAEFWDGDCELVRYYREAAEYRKQRINEEAWLSGLYIYEAIADLVPVLNPLTKPGTRPTPSGDNARPVGANAIPRRGKANSLKPRVNRHRIDLRRLVLVVAFVVRILRGVRDNSDARYADGVEAHRLRLGARRERGASAPRHRDQSAADGTEKHRFHRVPELLAQLLPVDLHFHLFLPFIFLV